MKSFHYLLTAVLFGALFTGCESTNPYDQTVFRLEEGPRPGSGGNRYGYRGDGSDQQAGNRRARRSINRNSPEPATTDRGNTRILGSGEPAEKREDVRDEVADDFASGSNESDESGGSTSVADTTPMEEDEKPDTKPDTLKPASTSSDKPFAESVPGKYGHVISPFAPGREVDVTGFPPGTEVRCPYTQRIFRVP